MTNTEQWNPQEIARDELADVLLDASDGDVSFADYASAVMEALDAGKVVGYGPLPICDKCFPSAPHPECYCWDEAEAAYDCPHCHGSGKCPATKQGNRR